MRHSVAVAGLGVWDGKGKAPTGGSLVTYELTKRLSEYFDCTMMFETSDKSRIGKVFETEDGFKKAFIPRIEEGKEFDRGLLRNYDLVHLWGHSPLCTYRAYTGLLAPHCHTLHSAASIIRWAPLASNFYLDGYDRVALGSHCLSEALERICNIPAEVIPYGVDTELFKPMSKEYCRRQLSLPENRLVLGYLGRPAKLDLILAYETFKKIKKATKRRDLLLIVAGGSIEVKPTYISGDFVYLGYLDRRDIPIMLNSCDIFYNPVAGIQEGFGLSIIEAMACGLPIVTTSWNGYRETVKESYGFLARTCWKDGDVWINQDDIVSSCVHLIKDEGFRETCGREARRTVENKYVWKYCVERYRDLFLRTIQEYPLDKKLRLGKWQKVSGQTYDSGYAFSLTNDVRFAEFRSIFEKIYKEFVSDQKVGKKGWRRFICKDNILNLPKYRFNTKNMLAREKERLRTRFPKLYDTLRF